MENEAEEDKFRDSTTLKEVITKGQNEEKDGEDENS
jgi:hypothetical protein